MNSFCGICITVAKFNWSPLSILIGLRPVIPLSFFLVLYDAFCFFRLIQWFKVLVVTLEHQNQLL